MNYQQLYIKYLTYAFLALFCISFVISEIIILHLENTNGIGNGNGIGDMPNISNYQITYSNNQYHQ